jgi:hypothetical protein
MTLSPKEPHPKLPGILDSQQSSLGVETSM